LASHERPILSSRDDFLQLNHRVDRVLGYLLENERNTVAIVGHYGSGKTSLANLVAEKAKSNHPKNLSAPPTPLRISLRRKLHRTSPLSHVLDLFTPVNLMQTAAEKCQQECQQTAFGEG
jgi:ABC-type glutathione transport system ATPase component